MEETLPDTLLDGNLPDGEVSEEPENDETDKAPEPVDISSDPAEAQSPLRRSHRHREKPKRFQYHQLGNPLISIVQFNC